jgi:hypothetical protein
MDLTQRFQFVASVINTCYPNMEVDKPYPILHAYTKFRSSTFITTLILQANDKSVEYCNLDSYYSFVFSPNDILEINAKRANSN